MVRFLVLLGTLFIVSAAAPLGGYGVYEESTTSESSGDGSGSEWNGSDSGFASGADSIAIDMDCTNKEDGLYSIGGCSPQFLTCSGGIARIMDCPADLIYDHRIIACEYATNVPECGGAPQDVPSTEAPEETTAVVVEETTAASGYVISTPASDEPVTRAAIERTCVGQPDGFYSYGACSDHYTACSNGYTIPMQCPANLAFDEARVVCDYRTAVPECQNGSGNDEGSAEDATTEFSGELPYDNGYGYEETTTVAETTTIETQFPEEITTNPYVDEETTTVPETTTIELGVPEETTTNPYVEEITPVSEDAPSTSEGYGSPVYAPYVAPYGILSTTSADIPTTTAEEVTTTVPYVEETTTTEVYAPVEETTPAADEPSTTEEVTVPYVEETTTTEVYAPVEETTPAADEPSTTEEVTVPYVEETTTTEVYAPVEETTPAADEPSTTEEVTLPYVEETTTTEVYAPVEETTPAADEPSTTEEVTVPYVEETTTTEVYAPVEETTPAADVPSTTEEVTLPYVEETTTTEATSEIYVPEETTIAADIPSCIEGASSIDSCSQNYKNCVNGQEAVFTCESGLFFSQEQGVCTPADQIPECHPVQPY